MVTDANGGHVGYQTNDAYPVVSEDGQSLVDDQLQGKVTIRDGAGAIVQEFATAGAPPGTGPLSLATASGSRRRRGHRVRDVTAADQ